MSDTLEAHRLRTPGNPFPHHLTPQPADSLSGGKRPQSHSGENAYSSTKYPSNSQDRQRGAGATRVGRGTQARILFEARSPEPTRDGG